MSLGTEAEDKHSPETLERSPDCPSPSSKRGSVNLKENHMRLWFVLSYSRLVIDYNLQEPNFLKVHPLQGNSGKIGEERLDR